MPDGSSASATGLVGSNASVSKSASPPVDESIENVTKFEDLPENCRKYVEFIENFVGVRIGWIGTGPARDSMIMRA